MTVITPDNPAEVLSGFAAFFMAMMILFFILCRG